MNRELATAVFARYASGLPVFEASLYKAAEYLGENPVEILADARFQTARKQALEKVALSRNEIIYFSVKLARDPGYVEKLAGDAGTSVSSLIQRTLLDLQGPPPKLAAGEAPPQPGAQVQGPPPPLAGNGLPPQAPEQPEGNMQGLLDQLRESHAGGAEANGGLPPSGMPPPPPPPPTPEEKIQQAMPEADQDTIARWAPQLADFEQQMGVPISDPKQLQKFLQTVQKNEAKVIDQGIKQMSEGDKNKGFAPGAEKVAEFHTKLALNSLARYAQRTGRALPKRIPIEGHQTAIIKQPYAPPRGGLEREFPRNVKPATPGQVLTQEEKATRSAGIKSYSEAAPRRAASRQAHTETLLGTDLDKGYKDQVGGVLGARSGRLAELGTAEGRSMNQRIIRGHGGSGVSPTPQTDFFKKQAGLSRSGAIGLAGAAVGGTGLALLSNRRNKARAELGGKSKREVKVEKKIKKTELKGKDDSSKQLRQRKALLDAGYARKHRAGGIVRSAIGGAILGKAATKVPGAVMAAGKAATHLKKTWDGANGLIKGRLRKVLKETADVARE